MVELNLSPHVEMEPVGFSLPAQAIVGCRSQTEFKLKANPGPDDCSVKE
jgi:hypothetical protein